MEKGNGYNIEEKTKLEYLIKLEEISLFFIELYNILYKHQNDKAPYIAIKEGYEFISKNKKLFLEYTILSLKEIFTEENNNKFTTVLNLFQNVDFIIFIEAFKNELQKENKTKISTLVKEYIKKTDQTLKENINNKKENEKLTKSNKMIITGNKILQNLLIDFGDKEEKNQKLINNLQEKLKEVTEKLKEVTEKYNKINNQNSLLGNTSVSYKQGDHAYKKSSN